MSKPKKPKPNCVEVVKIGLYKNILFNSKLNNIQTSFISIECPSGKYGQNCERQCKCLNGGKCNHVTGKCDCKVGFYGDICLGNNRIWLINH